VTLVRNSQSEKKRGNNEKSPQGTLALKVRQKSRQEALDTMDSFREGPPAFFFRPLGVTPGWVNGWTFGPATASLLA
jgi:hypothetical protein